MTRTPYWTLVFVFVTALPRIFLWRQYEVLTVPDSGTYMDVALALERGTLAQDAGGRTPGYPIVLLAAAMDEHRVWLLQMAIGVATSLILFHCCFLLTRSILLSLAVALGQSLNLAQLFFEAVVAPETITTMWVATTVMALLALADCRRSNRMFTGLALSAGLTAAAAAITRPQYVYLPAAVALIVWLAGRRQPSLSPAGVFRTAVLGLAPGLVTVLAWSGFNYLRHDYFAFTTYLGINLTNHTIVFADSAPASYQDIAPILVRYRDAKLSRTGRYTMAVWEALPELEQETRLPQPQLFKRLAGLSLALIVRNPLGYAKSVLQAWKDFWMVPNQWEPERIINRSVRQVLVESWEIEKWFLRLMNVTFLVSVFLALVGFPQTVQKAWNLQATAIAVVVFGSSVMQALFEYGENPRYAVTVQSLVVLFVVALAYRTGHPRSPRDEPNS